jgi:hypothetical protein
MLCAQTRTPFALLAQSDAGARPKLDIAVASYIGIRPGCPALQKPPFFG